MSDRDESRREFLHLAGGCFVLALGLPARAVLALPVTRITGRASGETRTYPLPAADGVHVDYDAQVILVRALNRVFAFNLSCPHENAAVKWVEKDRRFQCTKHDSKYQPDGLYMSGRATRNLDRFALRRDGASVVVDLERLFQSDKDPAGWAAAGLAV
jgi:nitrite reductase/ring-hydroxylating ferredoxin subunit